MSEPRSTPPTRRGLSSPRVAGLIALLFVTTGASAPSAQTPTIKTLDVAPANPTTADLLSATWTVDGDPNNRAACISTINGGSPLKEACSVGKRDFGPLAAGTHQFKVDLEVDGRTLDSKTRSITVAGGGDADDASFASAIGIRGKRKVGKPFTASVVVDGPDDTTVDWYLDETWQGRSTGTSEQEFIPVTKGTHTVMAVLDLRNVLVESDEGNNSSSKQLQIGGADGKPSIPTWVSPPDGGTVNAIPVLHEWTACTPNPCDYYWLTVGSTPSAGDMHDSGVLASTTTSHEASNIATNNSEIHATLHYHEAGFGWASLPVTYRVSGPNTNPGLDWSGNDWSDGWNSIEPGTNAKFSVVAEDKNPDSDSAPKTPTCEFTITTTDGDEIKNQTKKCRLGRRTTFRHKFRNRDEARSYVFKIRIVPEDGGPSDSDDVLVSSGTVGTLGIDDLWVTVGEPLAGFTQPNSSARNVNFVSELHALNSPPCSAHPRIGVFINPQSVPECGSQPNHSDVVVLSGSPFPTYRSTLYNPVLVVGLGEHTGYFFYDYECVCSETSEANNLKQFDFTVEAAENRDGAR